MAKARERGAPRSQNAEVTAAPQLDEGVAAPASECVGKLQSGSYSVPPERERVDLQALCDEVCRLIAFRATERGLTLEVTQFAREVRVHHRSALRFVLIELLEHVFEEAALGSVVTLLTTARRNSTEIRIIDWRNGDEWPSKAAPNASEWGSLPEKLLELRRVLTGKPTSGCIRVEQAVRARGICIKLPNDH